MKIFLKNNINRSWLLYEGLIYSVNADTALGRIGHWLKFSNKLSVKKTESRRIHLKVGSPLKNEEWELLQKLINNLGWFIASYISYESGIRNVPFESLDDLVKKNPYIVILEAKYDDEIGISTIDTVFHVSPEYNYKKIEKLGLVPKSKSKISYHPDRIYLAKKEKDAETLIDIFKFNEDISYTLYKIDLRAARQNDPGIRIFNDPNMSGAFYTLSNIPPQFLKPIKRIN